MFIHAADSLKISFRLPLPAQSVLVAASSPAPAPSLLHTHTGSALSPAAIFPPALFLEPAGWFWAPLPLAPHAVLATRATALCKPQFNTKRLSDSVLQIYSEHLQRGRKLGGKKNKLKQAQNMKSRGRRQWTAWTAEAQSQPAGLGAGRHRGRALLRVSSMARHLWAVQEHTCRNCPLLLPQFSLEPGIHVAYTMILSLNVLSYLLSI